VEPDRSLWRAIRWPVLVLAVALAALGVAAGLDRTASRELSLTIGGPALTVLLPAGLVWLVIALILRARRRRAGSSRQRGP
jgi:hypothetical protein